MAFPSLGLRPELLSAVAELGFQQPTPIQEKTIPFLIEKDNDLVALAQTGTGKTAAFGLPLLQRMDPANMKTQALVLCPTRELCLQITGDLANFGRFMPTMRTAAVYGGASIENQAAALRRGAQIVVGTPGRTLDLIRRGDLRIGELRWLILDEADEMLNRGFKRDLDAILASTPRSKRTLLFSATMPPEIAKIAQDYLHQPEKISVGQVNAGATSVSHAYLVVPPKGRYEALCDLLDEHTDLYGIVFCRTKRKTREVSRRLKRDGYPAVGLEGDMSQPQRDKAMEAFRSGKARILVATDVAARGMDVSGLSHVIHFNLPDDDAVYVHRSGRTGRAGLTGQTIALLEAEEMSQLPILEKLAKKPIQPYKRGAKVKASPATPADKSASPAVPAKEERREPSLKTTAPAEKPAQEKRPAERPAQEKRTAEKTTPERRATTQATLEKPARREQTATSTVSRLPQAQYRQIIEAALVAPLDREIELQLSALMPLLDELDRHEIVGHFLAYITKGK